jgi:tetratricopeptide (TPR) repeat protein
MEKRDFFISYNKEDKAWAKWIAGVLEEQGYSTYIQAWDIRPSDDFISKMNKFLECSRAFIPVLSENYIGSPYCEIECSAALDKRVSNAAYRFLPVRIADVATPDLIRTIVHTSIFDVDEVEAEKRLLHAVDTKSIPRTRPPFPSTAAQPRAVFPGAFPKNNLPDRNPHFTGRDAILEEIHRRFQTGQAVSLRQTVAGLGGVGKTQTALEYAYRHAGDYDDILWVNAESGLQDAYLYFARSKGLLPAAENVAWEQVREAVRGWFDQPGRFLIIYDNVKDYEVLDNCLPRISGHVLITTRDEHFQLGTALDITVFEPEEATGFLKERLGRDEGEAAKKLAARLGYLPLALEQAAAYMVATHETCQGYLELLEKHGLEMFDEQDAKAHGYKSTVKATWSIAIKNIAESNESAKQLLNVCAYCAPDKIPLSLLIESREKLPKLLQAALSDKRSRNAAVSELRRYSLLREKDGLLSIHRLVQEVVRDGLANNTQWIACCLNVAYSVFKYTWGDKQSMDAFAQNAPHVLSIAGYAGSLLEDDEEVQKKAAWLYHEAGDGLDYNGQYKEALEWYMKALAIREKVLGTDHPCTASTYNNIAIVYYAQGEYEKALEWYNKALAIREKVLGQEHPDTACTYANIAIVYYEQGYYDKALEWHMKGYLGFLHKLGEVHCRTVKCKNNMALAYQKAGLNEPFEEWLTQTTPR